MLLFSPYGGIFVTLFRFWGPFFLCWSTRGTFWGLPPHNSRDNLANFLSEFSATLIEYNTRGHNTCGDYNVDLLKINSVQFNENYFDSIISSGYVPTIT